MNISEKVDNIKIIYCPAHTGIEVNKLADSKAKTGAKKAKHLQPDPKTTLPELKQSNKVPSIKNSQGGGITTCFNINTKI